MTKTTMTLEEILKKYEAGLLADEADEVLHAAIVTLETGERTFFDDCNLSSWSVMEVRMGREARQNLLRITNFVLKLLLARYGCND